MVLYFWIDCIDVQKTKEVLVFRPRDIEWFTTKPITFGPKQVISLLLVIPIWSESILRQHFLGPRVWVLLLEYYWTQNQEKTHAIQASRLISLHHRPYVWGEKGRELHTLRKSLGPSLKQPRMTQVLEILDSKTLQLSIQHFPLRRKLQVTLCLLVYISDHEFVFIYTGNFS